MNKQEFIKKYRGAIPDPHNRTPWKRWEDIEKDMDKDLDELISQAISLQGKLFCTECKLETNITIGGMCPSCDKIRNEKETDPLPHQCKYCGKSFATTDELYHHQEDGKTDPDECSQLG